MIVCSVVEVLTQLNQVQRPRSHHRPSSLQLLGIASKSSSTSSTKPLHHAAVSSKSKSVRHLNLSSQTANIRVTFNLVKSHSYVEYLCRSTILSEERAREIFGVGAKTNGDICLFTMDIVN